MFERPESERRLRTRPRDRHPAAVPPPYGVAGPLPGRILQQFLGQALDLIQTQLVTLIDVRTAWQSQLEQHRRSGSFPAEGDIGVARRHRADPRERHRVDPVPAEPDPGDGSPVAGYHPGRVVVREHTGGWRTDHTCGIQGQVDDVALGFRGPLTHQRVEVEGRVQLVGADVACQLVRRCHPGLGHEHPGSAVGFGVRIGHPTLAAQDVMHMRLVHKRRAGQHVHERLSGLWVDVHVR
jgi:hypothetical protein